MKPFDYNEAKQGKPVCTRDGCKVRILCWDFEGGITIPHPIIALIRTKGQDMVNYYTIEGKSLLPHSEYDLFMDTIVKLEGYVNVFDFAGKPAVFSQVYATEQKAKEIGEKNSRYYVGTAKIVMEE